MVPPVTLTCEKRGRSVGDSLTAGLAIGYVRVRLPLLEGLPFFCLVGLRFFDDLGGMALPMVQTPPDCKTSPIGDYRRVCPMPARSAGQ